MRIAALGGLLVAVAGCNQVFGLEGTTKVDAAVVVIPDAAPRTTFLTWQLGRTTASGAVEVSYPAITPKPSVKIGPLPGQTIPEKPDWAPGELRDVDIDDAGGIDIDEALRGRTFRIVYRLAGETIDHEFQGIVSEGHLIVERFGPVDRTPPPANAGYRVPDPMALPLATFMTTGVWTQFPGVVTPAMDAQRGTYSTAHSMSGPLGLWDTEPGAKLAVCDRSGGKTTACAVVPAGQMPPLVANLDVEPAAPPIFDTTLTSITTSGSLSVSADARMYTALKTQSTDGLYGARENAGSPFYEYGLVPTLEMGTFTDVPAVRSGQALFPRPVMFQLGTSGTQAIAKFVVPDLGMAPVVYAHYTNTRQAKSGLYLVSLFQSVTPMEPNVELTFAAPMPNAYKLGGMSLDADGQALPALAGNAVELTWVNDQGASEDYEVTLVDVTGADAQPMKVWNVGEPRLVLDPAIFAAGKTYAFEIAARTGFPKARAADFTMVTYPASRSSLFAGTFCFGTGPCP